MQRRSLTQAGPSLPLLGVGTMRLPRLIADDPSAIDIETTRIMMERAFSMGANYFDTAYPYHSGRSELVVGQIVQSFPRDRFFLATKLPSWLIEQPQDVTRIFEEQLQRLQVDFFDFYLVHNIHGAIEQKLVDCRIYDQLDTLRRSGKIRYLGFSFHDKPDMLRRLVDHPSYRWDFAQLQINYLDWEMIQAGELYQILKERQIPCIVMEPVRGGALANLGEEANAVLKEAHPDWSIASWAIRYVASLPNVRVVLSGMSTPSQLEDNLNTMADFTPLTKEEQNILAQALSVFKKKAMIPCTNCNYCEGCPSGIRIPELLGYYNTWQLTKWRPEFDRCMSDTTSAPPTACIDCGLCSEHCPQNLPISRYMAELSALRRPRQ